MDPEKSSSSSFEDLSNLNEEAFKDDEIPTKSQSVPPTNTEVIGDTKTTDDAILDVIGTGQLTKKVLVKGPNEDNIPNRGEICLISYVGKLENGTIVDEEKNIKVQVGDVEIVQGMDMCLPLMKSGEIAEVNCDSRFAYGTIGLKKDGKMIIPPGAQVTYTLELHSFHEEKDLELLSYSKKKEIGNKKRERGNFWYDRNEFNLAIQLYRRALEFLDESEGGITDPTPDGELAPTNAQLQELLEDRVRVYNNLAMAQMKISAYDTALQSVENVLRCQPNNVKALFRKGKILDAKGDTNSAIPILQKAATLDADSKTIQQMLSKLILKQRREMRNEKDLYQKMLGHAQKLENNKQIPYSRSQKEGKKLKLLGYLMGTILIGVASVAMYRYKF